MGTSAFQQGTKIHFDKKHYIMLRKVTDEIWQLEDCSTKRIIEYTDDQLRGFYVNGQLTFVNSNAICMQLTGNQNYLDFSPEQWEDAKIRRAYVTGTLNTPNTLEKLIPVIREIWEKISKPDAAPNPVTVFRWKTKYIKAGNDIVSLIDRHDKKGNRARRYPHELIEFIQRSIDTIYLIQERGTVQDTLDRAYVLTRNENQLRPAALQLPLPTRRLVVSMIKA